MKKTLKKFAAVGLSLTSVMGLVACGSNSGNQDATKATVDWANVQKPEQFTVMVDGTVVKETNGAQEFYKYLGDLTGLDIKWIRPEHSSYYDSVKNAFASGDIPDVVLLSSDYLANFAANGYLWDMTDAWNQSATKNSGRLIDQAEIIESGYMVAGPDGEKALYGFSPARGNGCCTYIKSSALTAAGYNPEEVASKTLTYDEYYKMLKDMKAASANQNFVISCSGFIAGGNSGTPEAPYTNYLPEFYQNANFTFYYDEAAKEYKDGFAQQDMKDALTRLKTAVDDGILDKASQNQTTSDARNKWNAKDASTASSVFTYWAGTWAYTLQNSMADKTDKIIAIRPIKELGSYKERLATAWCITYKAYENGKAEGIFKYFIDTMLDGGDIQIAWQYCDMGTHWDDKAETVTVYNSKGEVDEKKTKTYEEGVFHFLPTPEDNTKLEERAKQIREKQEREQKNYFDALFEKEKFQKLVDDFVNIMGMEQTYQEIDWVHVHDRTDREDLRELAEAIQNVRFQDDKVKKFTEIVDWENFSIGEIHQHIKTQKTNLSDQQRVYIVDYV